MVLNNPLFVARNSRSGYQIEQSLRFAGGSTQYLYRTGAITAQGGVSLWVKFHRDVGSYTAGVYDPIIYLSGGGPWLYRNNYGYLYYRSISSGGDSTWSSQRTRDHSAWYHIFLKFNSSSSTSLYVNNVLWGTQSSNIGTSNSNQRVGYDGTYFAQYYLAEYHAAFGESLDATDFGEYNNGVWVPKEFTGNYGSQGFYLKFDPSAANGLGHDHSGNGNHFTNAGGFTTSGGFTDVMSDTPTKNWCTLNPLAKTNSSLTLSEGNLKAVTETTAGGNAYGTFAVPTSGKWYWEVTALGGPEMIGVAAYKATEDNAWQLSPSVFFYETGESYINGTGQSYGSSYTVGDLIGVACDTTAGTIQFYKNGAGMGSLSQSVGGLFPCLTDGSSGSAATYLANFGQREFAYPPGTYSATAYFNTVTWTGNGSTQSITGVGFQPDFVWTKKRSGIQDHFLFDVVRGSTNGNFYELRSSSTTSQGTPATASTGMTSLNADGFSVGSDGSVNTNNDTYVAWCWKAGGTASSNTDGSQTASVSANDAAGFSVMTWNYSGSSSYTVGHGLSTAPKFLILKKTDGSTNWFVRHGAVHTGNGALFLNSFTTGDSGSTVFNGTAPTNSVISLNGAITDVRGAHVCYAFAEKAGISKFGSYTGNGSVDGPEINDLGFAPALLVIKRTDDSSEWAVYDSARGNDNQLRWDQTDADNTGSAINVRLTSNGFKIATSDNAQNANGGTYIYMAWARNFSADADYKELNTANLPAPTIKDGSQYVNAVTWTGTGASRTIDFGMQPDWIWAKGRNTGANHRMSDIVRGGDGTTFYNLTTNATNVENTDTVINGITSTGVTFKNVNDHPNISGSTYVGWGWKANGSSTSSNTDGTITSTVSANPTAGFSIVTYTSPNNTADQTVGHGLGVKPSFIIVKNRDNTYNWDIYHSSAGYNSSLIFTSDAQRSGAFGAEPTSTVFTTKTSYTHNSTHKYVAYCFAEVEGYSKFGVIKGSYIADGPFIYLGFTPAVLIFKNAERASTDWALIDATRDPYNYAGRALRPNSSTTEDSYTERLDILSNGFKIRTSDLNYNGPDDAPGIIYAAFASNPFGGSGVSPATAR